MARHDVRIPMIEDKECRISKAFGVTHRIGGTKNITFVIDADGTLRKVYHKVKSKGHAAAVLDDCRDSWKS